MIAGKSRSLGPAAAAHRLAGICENGVTAGVWQQHLAADLAGRRTGASETGQQRWPAASLRELASVNRTQYPLGKTINPVRQADTSVVIGPFIGRILRTSANVAAIANYPVRCNHAPLSSRKCTRLRTHLYWRVSHQSLVREPRKKRYERRDRDPLVPKTDRIRSDGLKFTDWFSHVALALAEAVDERRSPRVA